MRSGDGSAAWSASARVVGSQIERRGPPVARRQILEQFDARPLARTKRRNAQPRAEHVVQALLLDVVVLAFAGHVHPQGVAIEAQCPVGVVNDDGRVIDAQEEAIGVGATSRSPLPGGK